MMTILCISPLMRYGIQSGLKTSIVLEMLSLRYLQNIGNIRCEESIESIYLG